MSDQHTQRTNAFAASRGDKTGSDAAFCQISLDTCCCCYYYYYYYYDDDDDDEDDDNVRNDYDGSKTKVFVRHTAL